MTPGKGARAMRAPAVALGLVLLLPLGSLAPAAAGGEGPYNGLDSWAPGMGYWAPISRSFGFVNGKGVQWHSLDPVLFPTDDSIARVYQFPNCPELRPVFGDDTPARDSPMRQVIDVVLNACTQPRSELDVFTIGVLHQNDRLMYVNAPIVPAPYASWSDAELFNGPPYRPRVTAFFEGQEVAFITYDVNWFPPFVGTAFPGHNVDIFLTTNSHVFVPGQTLFDVFNGAPNDIRLPTLSPLNPTPGTHRAYSPVWTATCVVDLDDPVCGSLKGPKFPQCRSIGECSGLPGTTTLPAGFVFYNCPLVATDLDDDGFLSELEEFPLLDLWEDSGWIGVI